MSTPLQLVVVAVAALVLTSFTPSSPHQIFASAFAPPAVVPSSPLSSSLQMAAISPNDSTVGTVGVIGRGYISVLLAKLSALRGYDTWLICPPGEEPTVKTLLSEDGTTLPDRLTLVEAADSDAIESNVATMSALLVAVDDTSALDSSVLQYLLNPELATKCQRVVAMSRNLNGSGMGFFVKASKATANSGVWDNSNADEFRQFEVMVKRAAENLPGCEWTICRSGTLKGGACGEYPNAETGEGGDSSSGEYCDQYLSRKFYELTKKDIVTWNLLFDINNRNVRLSKGDKLPGPGAKAVFTATSAEQCDGDTSRCGMAEAMVRSLEVEGCGNMDFGVATKEGRVPPSEEEWSALFEELV